MFQTYKQYQTGQEVEAVKLTADNADELEKILPDGFKVEEINAYDSSKRNVGLNFRAFNGEMMRASEGDYLLRVGDDRWQARPPVGFEMNWQLT